MEDLDWAVAHDFVKKGWSLQIHCDGGVQSGCGARAFVVHAHDPATGAVERVGYSGALLPTASSLFYAEVQALSSAVQRVKQFVDVAGMKR